MGDVHARTRAHLALEAGQVRGRLLFPWTMKWTGVAGRGEFRPAIALTPCPPPLQAVVGAREKGPRLGQRLPSTCGGAQRKLGAVEKGAALVFQRAPRGRLPRARLLLVSEGRPGRGPRRGQTPGSTLQPACTPPICPPGELSVAWAPPGLAFPATSPPSSQAIPPSRCGPRPGIQVHPCSHLSTPGPAPLSPLLSRFITFGTSVHCPLRPGRGKGMGARQGGGGAEAGGQASVLV